MFTVRTFDQVVIQLYTLLCFLLPLPLPLLLPLQLCLCQLPVESLEWSERNEELRVDDLYRETKILQLSHLHLPSIVCSWKKTCAETCEFRFCLAEALLRPVLEKGNEVG